MKKKNMKKRILYVLTYRQTTHTRILIKKVKKMINYSCKCEENQAEHKEKLLILLFVMREKSVFVFGSVQNFSTHEFSSFSKRR
jgi:hypothetical protein